MKIKNFTEFINEGMHGPEKNSLHAIAASIITTNNSHKHDVYGDRENFISKLRDMGFTETDKITPAILAKHPKFDELSHKLQTIITTKAGTGSKSPNGDFIKLFASAIHKFPSYDKDDKEKDNNINSAIHIKKMLDSDSYPDYTWLEYGDRQKLGAIMRSSEIKTKLTEDELKVLKKLVKPKYEEAVKRELTDSKIEEVILWAFQRFGKPTDDNKQFTSGIRLKSELPDMFDFIKEKMMGDGVGDSEWKSLDVKLKFDKSGHSDVVSSSFSTYYYYHIDATFAGKHFAKDSVVLGSSHFSGGWN